MGFPQEDEDDFDSDNFLFHPKHLTLGRLQTSKPFHRDVLVLAPWTIRITTTGVALRFFVPQRDVVMLVVVG